MVEESSTRPDTRLPPTKRLHIFRSLACVGPRKASTTTYKTNSISMNQNNNRHKSRPMTNSIKHKTIAKPMYVNTTCTETGAGLPRIAS